ncbi:MAG TPA: nitroreductase family deazaflavin-dependent oxidoreductase [Egibacteraceae bacterium]
MPLPTWLARANRRVTNRVLGPLAGRVPPLAVVEHRGRRSGRRHRTPIFAFRTGGHWVIALTYGQDVDWLRNVLAAGGCIVEHAGRRRRLTRPRVVVGRPRDQGLPWWVVPPLRLLRVTGYLHLDGPV